MLLRNTLTSRSLTCWFYLVIISAPLHLFSYTFQEVQDNTDCFWKFQRYELIKEYHSRPAYPPPFILLSHLYLLITRFLLCRPSKNKHRQFSEWFPAPPSVTRARYNLDSRG